MAYLGLGTHHGPWLRTLHMPMMKSLRCKHQIDNQGVLEKEGSSSLSLLEPHIFRQTSAAVTLLLIHKTEFSQGHTMTWGGGVSKVWFLTRGCITVFAECSSPTTSMGEGRGQCVSDLASIQKAQWTLSDMPSSDLLTPSRVINQPTVSSAYVCC